MNTGGTPEPNTGIGDPFEGFEKSFRRQHPVLWSVTLFGPFVATAVVLAAIWFAEGPEYTRNVIVLAAASLFIFGRFVILGGHDPSLPAAANAMSFVEIFTIVFYLDVAVAMVLAFHLGFLFHLPVIGPRLHALNIGGQLLLSRNPWIRRVTLLGITAFVSLPLTVTGSVGGSIFGRLLGLNRLTTFLGIVVGSLMGNSLMLIASDFMGQHVDKNHPLFRYGGLVVIVLLVVILEARYRRIRRQFEQEAAIAAPPPPSSAQSTVPEAKAPSPVPQPKSEKFRTRPPGSPSPKKEIEQ